jgi:hypothetical protein
LAKRFAVIQMLSRGRVVTGIACALVLTAVLGCTPQPALQFSPATLRDAKVGSPYAATITVSQPAGLDLALAKSPENTIQISGTPTVAGTFSFTIEVWCYGTNVGGQTATQEYTLVVK